MNLKCEFGAEIKGGLAAVMVGIDEACEWLETKTLKTDDMPRRIINRLRYLQAKDDGVKPRFHKGEYGKKYDYWSCGQCGAITKFYTVDNYCHKCGYRILWDSPRCLTGAKKEDEKTEIRQD